jgi:hypothetical protein
VIIKGKRRTAFHNAKKEDKMEFLPKATRKQRTIMPAEIGTTSVSHVTNGNRNIQM